MTQRALCASSHAQNVSLISHTLDQNVEACSTHPLMSTSCAFAAAAAAGCACGVCGTLQGFFTTHPTLCLCALSHNTVYFLCLGAWNDLFSKQVGNRTRWYPDACAAERRVCMVQCCQKRNKWYTLGTCASWLSATRQSTLARLRHHPPPDETPSPSSRPPLSAAARPDLGWRPA